MKHTVVAIAIAFVALTSPASTQQAPVATFRSGLEILTVEASVRDAAGRPLTGLEASDFVVSIDGQPRRVLTARMFGTDEVQVAKAGTPVPRFTRASDAAPGRVILFAVDRDSIRSGAEKAILNTAAAMMSSFSPADAAGVIGLPVGGLDPTRDHAAAAAAIGLMTGTRPYGALAAPSVVGGGGRLREERPGRHQPRRRARMCPRPIRSAPASCECRRRRCCSWGAGRLRPS